MPVESGGIKARYGRMNGDPHFTMQPASDSRYCLVSGRDGELWRDRDLQVACLHAHGLTDLRDRTCIVGIGETAYTRGTPKSALELALEASVLAIEDAGITPEAIDAVILPAGAGSGRTAGDFSANLGLQDLHYTTSLQLYS